MKKQISVLAISVLAASVAQANSFVIQDAVGNAMGGAGVANDATVGYNNNPALLINDERDHFAITIPSVGAYIEDGRGFVPALVKFVDEDIDSFNGLDIGGLNTAIGDFQTKSTAVQVAADNYNATPNAGTLTALQTANTAMTTSLTNVQTQIAGAETAVGAIENAFSGFSGKPMQVGLMGGLGLAVPNVGLPFSISASNNTYAGFQFDLVNADIAPITSTLGEVTDYVGLIADVSAANTLVIQRAGELQAILDVAGDATVALANMQDALDQLTAAETAANAGGVVSDSTGIDVNTMVSSIDLLSINVTEAGIATARQLSVSNIDFVAGVNLKFQNIIASGGNVSISDMSNDTAAAMDAIAGATESHMVFNVDLGFTKEVELGFGNLNTALVIKDLVPYSLATPLAEDVTISPQARIGVSHQTRFSTIVADLDITRNSAIGYGSETQYLNFGGELSAFGLIELRAGMKNNLAVSGDKAVTFGLGTGILGVALDFSGWFNPSSDALEMARNAGGMLQFSMKW